MANHNGAIRDYYRLTGSAIIFRSAFDLFLILTCKREHNSHSSGSAWQLLQTGWQEPYQSPTATWQIKNAKIKKKFWFAEKFFFRHSNFWGFIYIGSICKKFVPAPISNELSNNIFSQHCRYAQIQYRSGFSSNNGLLHMNKIDHVRGQLSQHGIAQERGSLSFPWLADKRVFFKLCPLWWELVLPHRRKSC